MKYFVVLLFTFLSINTFSEEKSEEFDLKPMCNQLYKISTSALAHKDKGMTKKELLKPLPDLATLLVMPFSKQKHLAQNMHRIANEIYEFEGLEMRSYSAFTAETCHRRLNKQPVWEDFSEVYPILLQCKEKSTPKERIDCGVNVSAYKNISS